MVLLRKDYGRTHYDTYCSYCMVQTVLVAELAKDELKGKLSCSLVDIRCLLRFCWACCLCLCSACWVMGSTTRRRITTANPNGRSIPLNLLKFDAVFAHGNELERAAVLRMATT
jgi:hypothetical protein